MADGRDKRIHKRVPDSFMALYQVKTPFELYIRLKDKQCDGIADDISEGRLALSTSHDIPSGAILALKFTLFNDAAVTDKGHSHKFELDGEVRYSEMVKNNEYRLGIRFVKVPDAEREFIVHYVRTQVLRGRLG